MTKNEIKIENFDCLFNDFQWFYTYNSFKSTKYYSMETVLNGSTVCRY